MNYAYIALYLKTDVGKDDMLWLNLAWALCSA